MNFILYHRPGCHLCHDMEAKLQPHIERLKLQLRQPVELLKRDIEAEEAWYKAYWDRIPVLTYNNRVILEGTPTHEQIGRAIDSALR